MRIIITEKNEVIVDIVRTNDFAKYINNLGFFLFSLPNKEVLSVRSKRRPNDHLFTVPRIIRDYQDEYEPDKATGGKHPTYDECLKKADSWVERIRKGYFQGLDETKYQEQFYKRQESL